MATITIGLALLLAASPGAVPARSFAADVAVGAPIAKGNLAVFPLRLRNAGSAPDVATLDEAVKAKQLAVEEIGAGGTVNTLGVRNEGDRPVMLMAGELLLGGKQDRIVARSLVLAPRSREKVPVFCVEHGRWSGEKSFDSGGAMGHVELRKMALSGDQSRVWDEVARSNARLGTKNASDTYRAAARKLGADAGPLATEISAALAREQDVAGLAVAIDGEVVAVEWFASPRVFERVREKLVSSYVAQALENRSPSPGAAPKPAPEARAVNDFAARAEKGEALVEESRAPTKDSKGESAPVQTTYLKR